MGRKIGIYTDGHRRADLVPLDQWLWTVGDNQYRQYSTAAARQDAAEVTFGAEPVELILDLGDMVDLHQNNGLTNAERATAGDTAMTAAIASYDALNIPFATTYGNHEWLLYDDDTGDLNNRADYWTIVEAATNVITKENEYNPPDGYGTVAYTFDMLGMRFVCMLSHDRTAMDAGALTWLTGTALDTTLPCVVFFHVAPVKVPNTYGYFVAADMATLQTALANAGNVQCVLNGHYHRQGIDTIHDEGSTFYQKIGDIPYYSFAGAALGANFGDDSTTATAADSAYYVVDIDPNAVYGASQWTANIEVTGYARGLSKKKTQYCIY